MAPQPAGDAEGKRSICSDDVSDHSGHCHMFPWPPPQSALQVEVEVQNKSQELAQAGVLPPREVELEVQKFRNERLKAAKEAKAQQAQLRKDGSDGSREAAAEKDGGVAGSDGSGITPVAGSDDSVEAAEPIIAIVAGSDDSGEAAEPLIAIAVGSDGSGETAAASTSQDGQRQSPKGLPEALGPAPVACKAKVVGTPLAKKPRRVIPVVVDGPNKEYYAEVQDDINVILHSGAFKDILEAEPLPIREQAECGIQEPFDAAKCATALRQRGTYISGFNFFWLDLVRSISPGIPLSRDRVRDLADWMFKDGPIPLKKPIGVRVTSVDFPVQSHKGGLLMITPEEMAHSVLVKVADAIRQGAKNTKEWQRVLLSVPVYIDVIPREDQLQWEAFNARQLILQEHWTMSRTAAQQCYEVIAVQSSLQKDLGRQPAKKEISDKFRKNAKLATGRQEDFSENFIVQALIVYEKVLSIPKLAAIIMEQEKRDGQKALWNHMGKLSVLALKTADHDERKWAMDALEDMQVSGGYSSDDLSKNLLQGDRSHVGVIQLLTFKYKVLARWVGYWFTAVGLRAEDVAVLQERTRLHTSCLAAAGAADADQSWLGRLKPSAVAAFRLLEAPKVAMFPVAGCCVLYLHGGGIYSVRMFPCGRQLSSRGTTTMF